MITVGSYAPQDADLLARANRLVAENQLGFRCQAILNKRLQHVDFGGPMWEQYIEGHVLESVKRIVTSALWRDL